VVEKRYHIAPQFVTGLLEYEFGHYEWFVCSSGILRGVSVQPIASIFHCQVFREGATNRLSVITILCCVTSQKIEYLIYTASEP
jgi:hypothetical protein